MSIQDYTYILDPGAEEYQPVGEADYIFVRFADRPVELLINNETVTLENGAEYEARGGLFSKFVIKNPDPENTAIVRLAIGTDRFRTRIITGDITTTPGIRTGDGSVIPDTRKRLDLDVISVPGTGITENYGAAVATFFEGGAADWALIDMTGTGLYATPPASIDYNPAVHDLPIAMAQPTSGGGTYYAFEFDPITKKRGRYIGPVQDLGQQQSFTVYGDIHYQVNSFGTKGVFKRNGPSGSWELLVSLGSPRDMCVLDNGNLAVLDYGDIRLISPAGEILGSYNGAQTREQIMTRNGSEIWAFSSANYVPDVVDYNLVPIAGAAEGILDSDGPCFGYGPYMVEMPNDDRLYVRPLDTVTDLFAGRAYLACENAWLGPRPTNFEAVRTSAAITVDNAETGNPTVSGEVIKLVMEWYLGRQVPDNYLDYVHAVRISGSTNLDGARFPPQEILSNGQTFLAAKIPDDFRVIFPIDVELTIDQRAEL